MAKFNYNIYYKDAQTGQDLASPVSVGYDDFETLIAETHKSFNGYTARELDENQKRTPSESSYNNDYRIKSYLRKKRLYELQKKLVKLNNDTLNYEMQNYPTSNGGNVTLIGKWNPSGRGSMSYFSNIKVVSADSSAEILARPLSYYGSEVIWNYSDLYRGQSKMFYNVSRTMSGKTVNMRITLLDYDVRPDAYSFYNNPSSVLAKKEIKIKSYYGSFYIQPWAIYRAKFRFDFYDDATNEPLKLLISTVLTDMDYNQVASFDFNYSYNFAYLIPPGSEVGKSGNSFYDGATPKAILHDDGSEIPKGTAVVAGIGNSITFEMFGNLRGRNFIDEDSPNGTSFVMQLFGNYSTGQFLSIGLPPEPVQPTYTQDITILYDRVARIRPWAIRNSGSWKSFGTKNINMVKRRDGEFMQLSTEVNEEDVGKQFTRLNNTGNYLPSYSLSGQGIRKSGVWKQQGKIGS